MRERGNELGATVWVGLLILIMLAILTFGGFGINKILYPAQVQLQREVVQQSKSFVDSTNTSLINFKAEHGRLAVKIAESKNESAVAAYKAQQNQLIEQMCKISATMDKATIDRDVVNFINEKGGC